jgi:hypothetical protein
MLHIMLVRTPVYSATWVAAILDMERYGPANSAVKVHRIQLYRYDSLPEISPWLNSVGSSDGHDVQYWFLFEVS